MALLLDEDYTILAEAGLTFEEDEANRILVIKNFPLPSGLYQFNGTVLDLVEILLVIPSNYNSSGNDMFWIHPALARTDGKDIPAAAGFGGGDPRHHGGKEYCRWSRHWSSSSWKPTVDNVSKMLDRVEWALRKPDADK